MQVNFNEQFGIKKFKIEGRLLAENVVRKGIDRYSLLLILHIPQIKNIINENEHTGINIKVVRID